MHEKMKEIKVVVMAPRKRAEIRTIPNTLQALSDIVGGYLEMVRVDGLHDGAYLYANEEGALQGLEENFSTAYGILCGTVVASASDRDGNEVGLSTVNAERVRRTLDHLTGRALAKGVTG